MQFEQPSPRLPGQIVKAAQKVQTVGEAGIAAVAPGAHVRVAFSGPVFKRGIFRLAQMMEEWDERTRATRTEHGLEQPLDE